MKEKLLIIILSVFVFITLLNNAFSAVNSVPQSLSYSGYITDANSIAVTGAKKLRFSIYAGATKLWYAEYNNVAVENGFFGVELGETTQGGTPLDPVTGADGQPANLLPIAPFLFVGTDSLTPLEIELEVFNDNAFETFSPRVKLTSSALAMKADTLDGFDSSDFVRFSGGGAIMAKNNASVVDSTGNWVGPAIVTKNKFKFLQTTLNNANLVLDCGVGYIAIGGGGACASNQRIYSMCPCTTSNCTSCVANNTPQRYWIVKCSSASTSNMAYATCVAE